ncbi:hypothetical protein ACJPQX_16995 [Vibrio vulnificus]|uniref:hypothetical protein n=1 Tax=Vibrio vulnificus TaxID=672 RepID=UPI003D9C8AC6
MTKLKMMPLVAMISAGLVGCGGSSGGGGGGGPVVKTYTWQVVDLYKVERSKVPAGCAIFANVSDGSGDVIASRVADRGYRVLFHKSDGTVDADKTISGSAIPATGAITFKETDIPDGGYVSIEEYSGFSAGLLDISIFGVQKDLMQNMTIAIRTEQATNNSCYKGEKEPEDLTNANAVMTVTANNSPAYFMTSASRSFVSGGTQPVGLSVHSGVPSLEKKLITAFSTYSNGEANNLTQYVIAPIGAVYDSTVTNTPPMVPVLDGTNVDQHNFIATDLALSNSGVEVVLSGEVYEWQPLYDSTNNYSIVTNDSNLSQWSLRLNGVTPSSIGGWNYSAQKTVSGEDISITYPTLSSFAGSAISSANCSGVYCVKTEGFAETSFQVQRTAIRSLSVGNRNFYQTVYSTPAKSQVVLQSASEVIAPKSTDVIEVALVDSDAKLLDSAKYLMESSLNKENHLPPGGSVAYKDFVGVVMLPSEQLKYKKLMMDQNYQALSNRVN